MENTQQDPVIESTTVAEKPQPGPFDWLEWGAAAAVLDCTGIFVICPGVAVQLIDGQHVALVEGGQRSRVDFAAVDASARRALERWPADIARMEVHVMPDPPRNRYTRRGRAMLGLS